MTQQVLDQMAHFTIRFIYNDKASKSLGDARALKWSQMKRKSTSRIPPDQDSHNLHVTRANYQVYVLLNYDSAAAPPSPINHGWTMKDGQCVPNRYTQPALPNNLNEIIEQQLQSAMDIDDSDSDELSDSDSDELSASAEICIESDDEI